MDIPILGTIDLTPSGIFLFFAAVLAVGYFGYQLFGTGRASRKADEASQVTDGESAGDGTEHSEGVVDDASEPTGEIDKDARPKG